MVITGGSNETLFSKIEVRRKKNSSVPPWYLGIIPPQEGHNRYFIITEKN
jgi:hypothetical protein